jgi:hypothetical protein
MGLPLQELCAAISAIDFVKFRKMDFVNDIVDVRHWGSGPCSHASTTSLYADSISPSLVTHGTGSHQLSFAAVLAWELGILGINNIIFN